MNPPSGIVRALLKTTLTEHLWASFFLLSFPLLSSTLFKNSNPTTLLFLMETGCYAIHGFSAETGNYAILGIAGIRYITYRYAHPALSPRLRFFCSFFSQSSWIGILLV